MAKNRPKPGKQETMAGMEGPPPIQAIENAADELYDALDEQKAVKERVEKAQVSVMGKMRAAKRAIYRYRDRTITLNDKETIKVKNEKRQGRKRKETLKET